MKWFTTEIKAIDPLNGELKTWGGQNVQAINWNDAEDYLQKNGLGYAKISGELIMEIPTLEDGVTPNWKEAIDY